MTPSTPWLRETIRELHRKSADLKGASAILGIAGDLVSYREEICNPTTVLGVQANSPFAVVTALSTLGTGIALLLRSCMDDLAVGYGYDERGV